MSTFFVPRFLDIKTIASPVPNSWGQFYKAGNLHSSLQTAVTQAEDTFYLVLVVARDPQLPKKLRN